MRTLLEQQGASVRKCGLGCCGEGSVDDLLHYCVRPMFREFASRLMPRDLGIDCSSILRKPSFFLLNFKDENGIVRLAPAM